MREIRLHDTLSGTLRPLETREPGRVGIYACGPTVYSRIHVGNARPYVVFSLLKRFLEHEGYAATLVINVTDVNDKIYAAAAAAGLPSEQLAREMTATYVEDTDGLGLGRPDHEPLATETVGPIVALIEALIERGHAYAAGGDVYFRVRSFGPYGKLSNRALADMEQGEDDINAAGVKESPHDFALWKAGKPGEDTAWDAPWGRGRPGWHIECSVMSTKYLGMGFDIHGGASDLTFPHHENEIAQAEALAGAGPFVRFWMHAGLVQMESQKMSKSLGNVVLVRDVVARYPGEVARYWALAGSYRTQLTFSDGVLDDSAQAYDRWSTFLAAARHALGGDMPATPAATRPADAEPPEGPGGEYVQRFTDTLDDDFNSSGAFAVVHDLVREANRCVEGAQRGPGEDRNLLIAFTETFLELTSVMGFRFDAATGSDELTARLIDYLLELREGARRNKEFAAADGIRDRLESFGVSIEDTPVGPRWRLGTPPAAA